MMVVLFLTPMVMLPLGVVDDDMIVLANRWVRNSIELFPKALSQAAVDSTDCSSVITSLHR
eukprot:6073555-Karenia_brevis.AAC.1